MVKKLVIACFALLLQHQNLLATERLNPHLWLAEHQSTKTNLIFFETLCNGVNLEDFPLYIKSLILFSDKVFLENTLQQIQSLALNRPKVSNFLSKIELKVDELLLSSFLCIDASQASLRDQIKCLVLKNDKEIYILDDIVSS